MQKALIPVVLILLAVGYYMYSSGRSEAHLLDLSHNGQQTFLVNMEEPYQAPLKAWTDKLQLQIGDYIELKSRPNEKDQTYEYKMRIKESAGQFIITFDGSDNPQGTTSSLQEMRAEVYTQVLSNLGTHEHTVLNDKG